MGDVVNLNKARKQRARSAAEAKAVENRVRFGRDKASRRAADAEKARAERELDGHEREKP